jgi:hypothetical protein
MGSVARTLLKHYPGRTALGLVLMASQAFIYNAIFFTYALVLTKFYESRPTGRPLHPAVRDRQLPGAAAARPLFDTFGRKPMIAATYALAGVLLAVTAHLFQMGLLDAHDADRDVERRLLLRLRRGQRRLPHGRRMLSARGAALTIALFYAFGTLLGGVGGRGCSAC